MFRAFTKPHTSLIAVFGLVVVLQVFGPLSVKANEQVTVSGQAVPWRWVNGGLNTNYQFGVGYNNQQPPAIVSASITNDISFIPDDTLTFSYLSGEYSANPNVAPYTDANGAPSWRVFHTPSDATNFPCFYVQSSEFPINEMELIGTFTDGSGKIVGAPHVIGDLRTLTIPAGATQFQLGAVDNNYTDNTGSVTINVHEAAVPEPSTLVLLGMGVVSLLAYAWRKRRRA